MSQVTEAQSGVYGPHIAAIARVAHAENTFIFIRKSEADTAALIGLGLATKSVDVHSKSSNWGPMAGMVPCNPVFSKTGDGQLKATGSPPPTDPHHPGAIPAQLVIPARVFNGFTVHKLSVVTQPSFPQGGTPGQFTHYTAQSGTGKGPAANVEFCLEDQGGDKRVYWLDAQGVRYPLFVWCYRRSNVEVPVTGDYDLWMVVPHLRQAEKGHLSIKEFPLTHPDGTDQGETQTTTYMMGLIDKLNEACGRKDNPVFNHGAEAQNLLFTQPVEENAVAMFTPAGTSRMVQADQMHAILGACQAQGYVVYTNRVYRDKDPAISGMTRAALVANQVQALAGLGGDLTAIAALKRQHETQVAQRDVQRVKMAEFQAKLSESLTTLYPPMHILTPEDLPMTQRVSVREGHLRDIQELGEIVSTQSNPQGVSDEALLKWLRYSQSLLQRLAEGFHYSRSSSHFDRAMAELDRSIQKATQTPPGRGAGGAVTGTLHRGPVVSHGNTKSQPFIGGIIGQGFRPQ